MQIGGITKVTLLDFPGRVSCAIFTPGCNFRCPFCHNAALVDPRKIKKLTLLPEEEIFGFLKERKKFLDGVVVTGGEPTLQPDLISFLKKVKKLGFETMIETNGSKPKVLKSLIVKRPRPPLIDFVAMDYKTTFGNYPKVVISKDKNTPGVKSAGVKKSMRIIIKSGLPFEFRTTVVPMIHSEKVLVQMARDLKGIFENCKLKIENCRWVFQPFRPKNCLNPKFNKLKPFSQEQMEGFLKKVQKVIPEAKLRG